MAQFEKKLYKDDWGNNFGELCAPRSRQRIINSAAWYLWNTAFSKPVGKVSSDENHSLLFYNLSERGNPKGSVACCRFCQWIKA